MTSHENHDPGQIRDTDQTSTQTATLPSPDASEMHEESLAFGSQLREAREALGLSIEDAGRKLCLPARVLRQLEADNFTGIDSPIYLRGYLRSYSGLLGVELPAMPAADEKLAVRPLPLATTGGVSHGRFLLQRYAVASTYLVITALIVVPIIVLGLNGGLHRDFARLAPLDVAAPGSDVGVLAKSNLAMPVADEQTVASSPTADRALRASMAPFLLLDSQPDSTASNAADVGSAHVPVQPTSTSHRESGLSISLEAPSWVEVTDAAGTRLEYALLPAGEYGYSSELAIKVLLGDSSAATVTWNGKTLDLAPFRHGNRARFKVDASSGAVTEPGGA